MEGKVRNFAREHIPHKRRLRLGTVRLLLILVFVLIQTAVLSVVFVYFGSRYPLFYIFGILLSVLAGIYILSKNQNPAFTIAWLVPIFLMPIFGGLLYLMFGSRRVTKVQRGLSQAIRNACAADLSHALPSDGWDAVTKLQSDYIFRASGCPPYGNTETEYYPSGEDCFPVLLDMISRAEKYIFLEYFIVDDGVMWSSILDILEKKAAAGLDVRLIYDDLGSIAAQPVGYEYTLRRKGIRTIVYNPFNTVFSPRPNNRDHRKLCIADGKTAITGGFNLADEYINVRERCGYWKDAGIVLRGDGAWGLTLQFLAVWDEVSGEKEDYTALLPAGRGLGKPVENGIVQPFTDVPMDADQVGETVYFHLITKAERYVYLTTPYLVLDHDLMTALCSAAESGVDVRLAVPHIPDKKTVFFLTRSYYEPLLDAGVKLYEFTPGFLHAKNAVCDDRYAVVGTINLDYRSLYLHMEDAVWMADTSAVTAVRDDYLAMLRQSEQITSDSLGKLGFLRRTWLSVLRTFAPLL